MCIASIFVTVAMNWKIVNNNAHSNIYADAPQRTLVVQSPQHFDRNNDGASLTTKAWSRLLHLDLLVKIFAFTPGCCINQVTSLLHPCGWVSTVCSKTFLKFFLRPSEPPSPSNVEAGVAWQRLDRLDNDPPKLSISTLVNSSPVVLTTS